MNYIARPGKERDQSIAEHLSGVADLAKQYGRTMDLASFCSLLGFLHDFGKYSEAFQSYIRSVNADFDQDDASHKKTDHSTAGGQWIWQKWPPKLAQYAAICIFSHHSGLIDIYDENGKNKFKARITKDNELSHFLEVLSKYELYEKVQALLEAAKAELSAKIHEIYKPQNNIVDFYLGLLTRYAFSCLIDADRADSADYENERSAALRQKELPNWDILIQKLEPKMAGYEDTTLNRLRAEISGACLTHANAERGIYTLTVPTGGGKTFASLRYALHHAKQHSLERIIFIIPFTSIIDQNAAAIRKLLDVGDEWILEHHSALEPNKRSYRAKIASESWDMPIIFTTMVQYLEALFDGGTKGARRMHRLAGSLLIFDEVQTVPVRCAHMFANALNFLVEHAGSSALLCTATQPLLDSIPADKGCLKITGNIIENTAKLFADLKRVEIINKTKIEKYSLAEIASFAKDLFDKYGSCLVVVNTKAWAKDIYLELKNDISKETLYHLSTDMCAAHRKNILKDIKERLKNAKPTICISTQLIEAGVDVDFAVGIRFLAGFDSIVQTAGRINREGERKYPNGGKGLLYIVNPDKENIGTLEDIKQGIAQAAHVLNEALDFNNPDTMRKYFEYYFKNREGEMSYSVKDDSLLSMLGSNANNTGVPKKKQLMLAQSFKHAGQLFSAIDAPSHSVVVPYKEGARIIAELAAADPLQEAGRYFAAVKQAQQYSVNMYKNKFDSLKEGIVYMGEIACLLPQYYTEEFGVDAEGSGKLPFYSR